MKKILLTLMIVSVLLCVLVITVGASELIGGIYYDFNANGTATVSAYNRENCTLANVVIPSEVTYDGKTYTVTSLADRCFGHQDAGKGNTFIKSVYIPSSVTYLGAQLFRNCTSLETVDIDATVSSIADGAFWSMSSLVELDLSGMTSLTSVNQLTSSCGKLTTVKLPSSLKTIGGRALQSANITELILPNGLESIGSNCFQANDFASVVIPASVKTIGGAAFHSIGTLKTVVFANPDISGYSTNVPFTGSPVSLIFYAGESANTVKDHFTQFSSFSAVPYETWLKNPTAEYKNTIVYGTKNCTKCGDVLNNTLSLVFTDYASEMYDAKVCSCGEKTNVKTYEPIIKLLGYSAKADENRLVVGYKIDSDSLARYEESTGKTISFGITASGVSEGSETYEPITDELTAVGNAVIAPLNREYDYTTVDFIINSFTENHYATPIVLCAFVADGSDVYYIGTGCGTSANVFTFNTTPVVGK